MMRSKELKEITPWGNLLQGVRGGVAEFASPAHPQQKLRLQGESENMSVEKHAAFYSRVSWASRQLSM